MKEIDGDLIKLAKEGEFDIIAHGANCFCTMGGGIARQIHAELPEAYEADCKTRKGDINKLGNFTKAEIHPSPSSIGPAFYPSNLQQTKSFTILNCYTQYDFRGPNNVDYEAITLCMRKINKIYAGKSIGLPLIGAGLAGGDWDRIKKIIETELVDMDVTIVIFNP